MFVVMSFTPEGTKSPNWKSIPGFTSFSKYCKVYKHYLKSSVSALLIPVVQRFTLRDFARKRCKPNGLTPFGETF